MSLKAVAPSFSNRSWGLSAGEVARKRFATAGSTVALVAEELSPFILSIVASLPIRPLAAQFVKMGYRP
jgi:hypothetical protein